jgi:hypothetical protein
MTDAPIEIRMFKVITFMFTACPVILDEPPIMAVARMMTAAERLIVTLEDFGLSDEFLSAARGSWLENVTSMMSQPEQFRAWVDRISTEFVTEAKARNNSKAKAETSVTP